MLRAVTTKLIKPRGPQRESPSNSHISLEQISHFTKLHPYMIFVIQLVEHI